MIRIYSVLFPRLSSSANNYRKEKRETSIIISRLGIQPMNVEKPFEFSFTFSLFS